MVSFIYLMCTSLSFFVLQANPDLKRVERIKSRYNLLYPHDYRAGLNKEDYFNEDLEILPKSTNLYELACMSLGYKKVALLSKAPPSYVRSIGKDKDINYLIHNKNFYYAIVPWLGGLQCLIYSDEGRHDALLLMRYYVQYQQSSYPGGVYFQNYLTGKVLGYSEEDIEFFAQLLAFSNKTDQPAIKAKEEFYAFLDSDWPFNDGKKFQKLKNQAISWINYYADDTAKLEKEIHYYAQRIKGFLNVFVYDRPINEFMDRYSYTRTGWWPRKLSKLKYTLKDQLNYLHLI